MVECTNQKSKKFIHPAPGSLQIIVTLTAKAVCLILQMRKEAVCQGQQRWRCSSLEEQWELVLAEAWILARLFPQVLWPEGAGAHGEHIATVHHHLESRINTKPWTRGGRQTRTHVCTHRYLAFRHTQTWHSVEPTWGFPSRLPHLQTAKTQGGFCIRGNNV